MVAIIIRATLSVTVLRRVQPLWWWAVLCATSTLMGAVIFLNVAALIGLKHSITTPAHYPLASLATADLLVGLFIMPVAVFRALYAFDLMWEICAVWKTLDVLCCTASILSLCVLGWERWSGITNPLARPRRAKLSKWLSLCVWPVSLAVALPTGFMWSPRADGKSEQQACPENVNVGYVFFSTALSFYLPVAVMLWFYAKIISSLRHQPEIRSHTGATDTTTHKKNFIIRTSMSYISPKAQGPCKKDVALRTDSVTPGSAEKYQILAPDAFWGKPYPDLMAHHKDAKVISFRSKIASVQPIPQVISEQPKKTEPKRVSMKVTKRQRRSEQRHRRATRAIIRLMSIFLLCWTPFFILLPIDSLCECLDDSLWETATWLGYTNSALNPFAYAATIWSSVQAIKSKMSAKNNNNDSAKDKKEKYLKKQAGNDQNDKKTSDNKNTSATASNDKIVVVDEKSSAFNKKASAISGKVTVGEEKKSADIEKGSPINVSPNNDRASANNEKIPTPNDQPSTSKGKSTTQKRIFDYLTKEYYTKEKMLTPIDKEILEIFQWIVADVENSKVKRAIDEQYGPPRPGSANGRNSNIVPLSDRNIPSSMFDYDDSKLRQMENLMDIDLLPTNFKYSLANEIIRNAN